MDEGKEKRYEHRVSFASDEVGYFDFLRHKSCDSCNAQRSVVCWACLYDLRVVVHVGVAVSARVAAPYLRDSSQSDRRETWIPWLIGHCHIERPSAQLPQRSICNIDVDEDHQHTNSAAAFGRDKPRPIDRPRPSGLAQESRIS